MSWRKWLVRGLVFSVLGIFVLAGLVYQRWTNSTAVRQQVIEILGHHLIGATINLETARLRILGGISLTELRLSRRDDPTQAELAYIPSATIYHDKEQLVSGKLAIRKIELFNPLLRVVRNKDGKWNIHHILGSPDLNVPIPTIIVHQGTILLEDHLAGPTMAPIEFTNVNLTLISDPIVVVNFYGAAKADLAQSVRVIKGSYNRKTGDAAVSLEAAGIAVGPLLVKRLAAYWPDIHSHAQHLRAMGHLQADFAYQSASPRPWTHNLTVHLTAGRFKHPQLPMDLQDLEATLNCSDGQLTLHTATARSGSAEMKAEGVVHQLSSDADLDLRLTVSRLAITEALFKHLPADLQKLEREFAPSGTASLNCRFIRKGGQWIRRCLIQPEDIAVSYFRFPYPLEHLSGTLDQEIDPFHQVDALHVDLTAYAVSQRVRIKGEILGDGPAADVSLKIWAENIPLDATLRAALPEKHQALAASFHPTGLANVEATIQRRRGRPEFTNHYLIYFHDASARYDRFSYPLENVNGILEILPGHWEFRDFHGSHKDGVVSTHGRSYPAPGGDRLEIYIDGAHFLLDAELEAALSPDIKPVWKMFSPAGRMGFHATVAQSPHQEPDIDVTVTANGCSILPTFFPYPLQELRGVFRCAGRKVHMENVSARHGATMLMIREGDVLLKSQGEGYGARLLGLRGQPLVPDDELLNALPRSLSTICRSLALKDPVEFQTDLVIDSTPGAAIFPVIYWDATLAFTNASLQTGVSWEAVTGKAACRGIYDGHQLEDLVGNLVIDQASLFHQPLRDFHCDLEVRKEMPNTLSIKGMHATIFGGELYGPARVEFGPPLRYELNLTASRIRLEEYARLNLEPGTKVSGLATARLHLTGQGASLEGLTGDGTFEVPNGHLYSLPPFLDLLKFLALRLPDGTAFEEAYASFAIKGKRVAVNRLDLFGNSISLRGQGDLNLDGTGINLSFYAVWARIIQYLPPLIKDIPPFLSQQLWKIKMEGRVNDYHFTKEAVPVLMDPLKDWLHRLQGRPGNKNY